MSNSPLKALLPVIPFEQKTTMSEGEIFQNTVLRPILKYQTDGLCRLTLVYCHQMNPNFAALSGTKKRKMLNDLLSGNQSLRNQLTGMVISFFEKAEWDFYVAQSKDVNKRIVNMIQVRVLDKYEKLV